MGLRNVLTRRNALKISAAALVLAAASIAALCEGTIGQSAAAGNGDSLQLGEAPALDAEVAVTLLDPVPDLLASNAVTTKYDDLAKGGRVVMGAGADEVTQLVLRISGSKTKVGDRFILTVLNDKDKPSQKPDEDGALEEIGKGTFNRGMITVRAVQTASGIFAFALYRAPKDFARAGGADDQAGRRNISISVLFANALPPVGQPVALVRPPVVLIHGLWANPSSWAQFAPIVANPPDPRFSVNRASYDRKVKVFGSVPRYPNLTEVSTNSLGLTLNAKTVLPRSSTL